MDVDTVVRGNLTYNMPLEEMIAAGNYCEVLENRDMIWPAVRQKGEIAMPRLHHFGKSIAPYEALKEMEKLGVRSANFFELLRFGAENQDFRPKIEEQIIFALDPDWWLGPTGLRLIPALVYWGRDRKWGLNLNGFRWHAVQLANVSFAVVDK